MNRETNSRIQFRLRRAPCKSTPERFGRDARGCAFPGTKGKTREKVGTSRMVGRNQGRSAARHFDQCVQVSFATLIGSNRAGRTTRMRAISGRIRPTGGEIKMGMGPASPVTSNLIVGALPRLTWAWPRGDMNADLKHAMVDLFPRLNNRPHQPARTLSGVKQKKRAMTRDYVEPDLALFDGPSMGLAPTLVEKALRIIANLKSRGVRILLLEKFAATELNAPDCGYALENGTIAEHSRVGELRNSPSVTVAFLDTCQCGFVGQTLSRHLEHSDCITQCNRVLFQRFRRSSGFFDQRSIVLRDFVDL